MTRRVVLQGGGSPLKIGVAGVDPGNASAFDLLFNADAQPLRLWGTGYVVVPSLSNINWSPAWSVLAGNVISTPAGTYPLFMVAGKNSTPSGSSQILTTAFHTTSVYSGGQGFGAFIDQYYRMWGVNFVHDAGGVPSNQAIVNYCILRNYG